MEISKRFAQASALTATIAMAAIVGNAQANPLPPKSVAAVPGAMAAPAPEPAPAVPTFVNGLAQNVFSAATRRLDQRRGVGRVELRLRRRRQAGPPARRLHAAQGDGDRRPEGPGHLRGQPVLRRHRQRLQATGASTTSSARSRRCARSRTSSPAPTRARRSARSTSRPGSRAASPSCTPSRPARATPTAARPRGGVNETLGATNVIDWLNGRRKAYTTRTGTVEAPPVNWHNGHTAMMGTSYNGTIPEAAATTGVIGLDAIVPISAI